MGTNKGVISILNTQKLAFEDGIRFPVSDKVQVEIKCLALSSEDEVSYASYACILLPCVCVYVCVHALECCQW